MLIGLVFPGADSAFEAFIYPVLGALLYVTFLQVPFVELRGSLADRRFTGAVLLLTAGPLAATHHSRPTDT